MPSVASEPQVFPPARTLPELRSSGTQDLSGFGAEPGGFAKLLDSDHESPAKPDRHDDTGPAKGRRSSGAAHAKHAKDKAPAQDEAPADAASQAAVAETPEDTAQQTSSDTSMETDQKTSNRPTRPRRTARPPRPPRM